MKKRTEIKPECAKRLKKLLSDRKMTQTDLHKMTGISLNTISKIINGKSPLTPYIAGEFVRCFPGTKYEWLMGDSIFETDLMEQGYHAIKPYMEKRKLENAVSSFFRSLNLSFSLNVPESSLLNASTDEFLSKAKSGEFSKAFEQYEDIIHSPKAYIIEKDGEIWGYCSEKERNVLFEEIFDFAEFSLLKLCNRGDNNG